MGKLIKKNGLTGGPCAGKTTAIDSVRDNLTNRGYYTMVTPEASTEVNGMGISCVGNNPVNNLAFQEIILQRQLFNEKQAEKAIKNMKDNLKCVVICDRGVLDGKAYTNKEGFDKILKKYNLDEIKLMDSYSSIIHMRSAAVGPEKYFSHESNKYRRENVEEARILDERLLQAWNGHDRLHIVDNSTNFENKIKNVVDLIFKELGIKTFTRYQRKFLIDLNGTDLRFLDNISCRNIKNKQIYLENFDNPDIEIRLRQRILNGISTYSYCEKIKGENGMDEVLKRRNLSKYEFEFLLKNSKYINKFNVEKIRYTFEYNNQYFKLDIYEHSNLAILEVEPNNVKAHVEIPNFIKIVDEVTKKKEYNNFSLAKKMINNYR